MSRRGGGCRYAEGGGGMQETEKERRVAELYEQFCAEDKSRKNCFLPKERGDARNEPG